MISRSLLLVLLVLACLQSFTTAQNVDGPDQCCFRFQTQPIPVRVITDYEVTDYKCTKPGVIFTLQNGRLVCADTGIKWVKDHMKRIDQRLFNSLKNTDGE
ncbi:C-C motif chemokine 4 homolog [Tachysurus vachellii]|uniref:C-C motif chemokine 4 homolog n=1 Tax=Tachysurus vachellii TaxID=175792 RepID=UPI00296B3E3C|nr:C-C motif chemokine 4 homolog [Tachysurus vachellii]